MITYKTGNIFDSGMEALVNPVNCNGVMGKGLALGFKSRYPKNLNAYKLLWRKGFLRPGECYSYNENGKIIINAATKDNWRDPSRYEWVESCLQWLANYSKNGDISMAIPALGCGLGGLDWAIVKPMMEKAFDFEDCPEIEIYEPKTI